MSKTIKIACCAVILAVCSVGAWRARPTKPSKNPLQVGQCTWYAYERANGEGWRIRFDHPYGRHARAWPDRVVNGELSSIPKKGEIMVLDAWPGNPYGHVAYVETVQDANHWTVTHANMASGPTTSTIVGVPIRTSNITRQGACVVFDDSHGTLPLIGFLAPKKTPRAAPRS